MAQNLNWNEMSSSDQDSWFDDDDEPQTTKTSEPTLKKQEQTLPSNQTSTGEKQTIQTKIQTEIGKEPEKSKTQKKKPFISDEQLLNLYTNKNVDDPKAIKISGCRSEDTRQIVKNTKVARLVQITETTFLMFFQTEQQLLEFIKEKIAKRHKFFLNQFFNRKREDQGKQNKDYGNKQRYNKQYRPRQPRQYKDKQTQQTNQHRYEKRERRQKEDNEQGRNKRRQQNDYERNPKKERREKGDNQEYKRKRQQKQLQKQKKVYLPKDHFELPQNSNTLNITSDNFVIQKVFQTLQQRKTFGNFTKIYIKSPFYALPKVATLCSEIAKKKKFYLENEPPTQAQRETIISLTLIQNGKNRTEIFSQKYAPKVQTKQIKQQSHIRYLGNKFDEYFKLIDKYNQSEIIKGFEEYQYIKRLRDANPQIQKCWSCWKILAEQDNIQLLLKLTNRIKKSDIYEIEMKPSLRNQKPLLTIQLRERPEKQRRPKVDVSNVNHYLS